MRGDVSTWPWLGAVLLALACGGSSAEPMNDTNDAGPVEVPPWACVPGETQPCDCGAELEGLRTCAADGSGFGECDCSPEAMSQGPPPTSTGTGDSGTGTGTDTAATDSSGPGPMTDGPGTTTMPDPTTDGGGSSSGGGGSTGGGSTGSTG